MAGEFSAMISAKTSQVDRKIFSDEEIFREEQRRIFAKAWIFVGHESQIPNAGDYFLSRMGIDPVILVRDKSGSIGVFHNSCRHRGMRVCRYDAGNTRLFTCSYHGWSFGIDGKLVGVPGMKEGYCNKLDKSEWGLIPVAKIANYKGAIWATWDADAVSLEEYLGDMRYMLDLALDSHDGTEGGSEVSIGVQKWTIPSNWKLSAENFIGDLYHNISHRSVDMVGIGPEGTSQRRDEGFINNATLVSVGFHERGHGGINVYLPPEYVDARPYPGEIGEWFRAADKARKDRLGENACILGGVGTVFPNMSFRANQPRQIIVWNPVSATETEVWSWYLFDAKSPDSVKAFMREYALRYCGPAGMTERDDMENWQGATEGSVGGVVESFPYNYAYNLADDEQPFEALPNLPYAKNAVIGATEGNARGFYRQWSIWMDATNWDEIRREQMKIKGRI
ncbi:aromatic ring-hydroxylating oxygenase subunit alpha [Sphingobium phenoxybenzoativorans]|nr:Rieske 2Fe-2S domain-containing protein [Sphingobium phenoxybenzoativorans]